jgi:hypothetical protein
MKENALFVLSQNVTSDDAKDGISERISKIQAITNYILADAANGTVNVSDETLIGAIWTVEGLAHELEILQNVA